MEPCEIHYFHAIICTEYRIICGIYWKLNWPLSCIWLPHLLTGCSSSFTEQWCVCVRACALVSLPACPQSLDRVHHWQATFSNNILISVLHLPGLLSPPLTLLILHLFLSTAPPSHFDKWFSPLPQVYMSIVLNIITIITIMDGSTGRRKKSYVKIIDMIFVW